MPLIIENPALCSHHNSTHPQTNMSFFSSLRSKARKSSSNRKNSDLTPGDSSTNDMHFPKPKFGSFMHKSEPTTRRPAPGYQSNNPFKSAPAEAPPAYSAAPPMQPAAPIPNPTAGLDPSLYIDDSDLAYLATFDTVILIDDSGSMAGRSWRQTAEALKTITPVCTAYDSDGIDIKFLNEKDNCEYSNITTPATVEQIFNSVRPRGATPTGRRLRQILKPYMSEFEAKGEDNVKPLNIIVITDGNASDDPKEVIYWCAERLDGLDAPPWQVGIQFFQVGSDPEATQMLEQLDNNLGANNTNKKIRDMVDTMSWESQSGTGLNGFGILKVVLGAVSRRHDNSDRASSAYRPH